METNEFELLPNDDAINMMNKEYNEQMRRTNLANQNTICPLKKHSLCNVDIKQQQLFAKLYFVEQDIIMCLKNLFSFAPFDAKDDIADLIKLKKSNSNLLLKCYYNVSDNKLSYAPNLSHDNNYCRLLKRICSLQKQLLLLLAKTKYSCVYSKKIAQNEWTCSYMLNNLCVFCFLH